MNTIPVRNLVVGFSAVTSCEQNADWFMFTWVILIRIQLIPCFLLPEHERLHWDFGWPIICLHLQKLEHCSYCAKNGTKGRAGWSPRSCAYRTTLQDTSKVQQPCRRSQDIKELWRISTGCLFFPTQRLVALTLKRHQIQIAVVLFSCLC